MRTKNPVIQLITGFRWDNSTHLSSAFMYLLGGEYNKLLPDFDLSQEAPKGAGTYMS